MKTKGKVQNEKNEQMEETVDGVPVGLVFAHGKKKSKLCSSKLWVTIWSIVLTSFIVFADRTAFLQIAQLLCAVPLAYIGFNVWQKKIYKDS